MSNLILAQQQLRPAMELLLGKDITNKQMNAICKQMVASGAWEQFVLSATNAYRNVTKHQP